MGECYVCCEECYTLSPCKCTNAYLHSECYYKLLEYKQTQCTMCLSSFPIPNDVYQNQIPLYVDEIDTASSINEEFDDPEYEQSCLWWFVPFLMRPPHVYSFNMCDPFVDFPRSMFYIIVINGFIFCLENPHNDLEDMFYNTFSSYWFLSTFLFVLISMFIRFLCTTSKRINVR